MANYDWFGGPGGFLGNNPILVRRGSGIVVESFEVRQLCDAVYAHPARTGTALKWSTASGQRRAHICTHANAHVELDGEPRTLPRVKEYIRHMVRLEAWVKELREQGYLVTISGDLNWAWDTDQTDWTYSPEMVFRRLGMATQFEHSTWVGGGTLGRRPIDYFAYSPDDLKVIAQSIVLGEHSDHRWAVVETETI